jgi:hypothetical protein
MRHDYDMSPTGASADKAEKSRQPIGCLPFKYHRIKVTWLHFYRRSGQTFFAEKSTPRALS